MPDALIVQGAVHASLLRLSHPWTKIRRYQGLSQHPELRRRVSAPTGATGSSARQVSGINGTSCEERRLSASGGRAYESNPQSNKLPCGDGNHLTAHGHADLLSPVFHSQQEETIRSRA